MVIFPIYIRKTYTTIWAKYKRKEMYRQKSVIFTIGKTLYIYRKYTFLGQNTKEKRASYIAIYKKTPTISVSIIYI